MERNALNEAERLANEALEVLFIAPRSPAKAVYASAYLEKIATQYPRAKITIVSECLASPLFAVAPHVEKIYAEDKLFRALPKIIFKKWDVVIDAEQSFVSRVLRCKYKANELGLNQAEDFAPVIHIADEHRRGAERRLFKKEYIIGVAPFNEDGSLMMPESDLIKVLKNITYPGAIFPASAIAVFGFEVNRRAANTLLEGVPAWQRVNLVGSLGLLSIEACLERCRFFMGGNSVITHMAAVADIATLAVNCPELKGRYIRKVNNNVITVNSIEKEINELWRGTLKQN